MAKTSFLKIQVPPPIEEYETTFDDVKNALDHTGWQGCGFVGEFPHNAGSLEEKLDDQEKRQIENSPRTSYRPKGY